MRSAVVGLMLSGVLVLAGCGPTGSVDIEDRGEYERAVADVEAVGEQLVSLHRKVGGTDVRQPVPVLAGCEVPVDYTRWFSSGGGFFLPLGADPRAAEQLLATAADELWSRDEEAGQPVWTEKTDSGLALKITLAVHPSQEPGESRDVAQFRITSPCLTFASGELAEQAEDELDERFPAEEQRGG